MYRPILVTAPTETPISLEEAKAHLREDSGDQNALITALINSAVSHLDGWTGILGRCLMSQAWRQDYDCFERCLRLPLFPVISVTSVKYDDVDGTEQTVSASNYSLQTDDLGAFVRFKTTYSFASVNIEKPAVRVAYVAGYTASADVPAAIKAAMLLLIGHWYANREAVSLNQGSPAPLPFAVDALLAPFRRIRF